MQSTSLNRICAENSISQLKAFKTTASAQLWLFLHPPPRPTRCTTSAWRRGSSSSTRPRSPMTSGPWWTMWTCPSRSVISRKSWTRSLCSVSYRYPARQSGDFGWNFAYFPLIFCLWYPICCFSPHKFTEFAYFCLFLPIFHLFSA